MSSIRLVVFSFFLLSVSVQGKSLYIGGTDIPEPVKLVESQTNILLNELSQRKDEFNKDPQALVYFARHVALSHWNLRKASRLMLGNYWKEATPEQRSRFEEEFLRTLLRYVVKAYGFYDESFVKILSYDWQAKGKSGWVRSVVRFPAGLKVSVDYRMIKNNKKQWKLVDIRVEGISLISHKRNEYRAVIKEKGMDALLKIIYDKNQKVLAI